MNITLPEDKWSEFKMIAARRKMTPPDLGRFVLKNYVQDNQSGIVGQGESKIQDLANENKKQHDRIKELERILGVFGVEKVQSVPEHKNGPGDMSEVPGVGGV